MALVARRTRTNRRTLPVGNRRVQALPGVGPIVYRESGVPAARGLVKFTAGAFGLQAELRKKLRVRLSRESQKSDLRQPLPGGTRNQVAVMLLDHADGGTDQARDVERRHAVGERLSDEGMPQRIEACSAG